MLSELNNAGISSIVISNATLTDFERDRILQHATRLIERPNIGYDFGGYRDGILELSERLFELKRIWLLNDSVWLISQNQSWFDQARSLNRDFVAATSSASVFQRSIFRKKQVDPAQYLSITWMHQPYNSNFHYASYALCVGSKILEDPKFLNYWKNLEIRNDKKKTVRRGEIGLTQWVLKNKYSHGATHEIEHLDKELVALESVELDHAAREVILLDDTNMLPIKKRVLETDADSAEGRKERVGLILTATARRGAAYALALYNIRQHQLSFLKKSPLWLSTEGPSNIYKYVSSLKEDNMHIAAEARMLIADRTRKNTKD